MPKVFSYRIYPTKNQVKKLNEALESCRWVYNICFEDLNVKSMTKNHNLANHILDAAWSKLLTYTSYKAERTGRKVVLVDPKSISKICSNCGMLVDIELLQEPTVVPIVD